MQCTWLACMWKRNLNGRSLLNLLVFLLVTFIRWNSAPLKLGGRRDWLKRPVGVSTTSCTTSSPTVLHAMMKFAKVRCLTKRSNYS